MDNWKEFAAFVGIVASACGALKAFERKDLILDDLLKCVELHEKVENDSQRALIKERIDTLIEAKFTSQGEYSENASIGCGVALIMSFAIPALFYFLAKTWFRTALVIMASIMATVGLAMFLEGIWKSSSKDASNQGESDNGKADDKETATEQQSGVL
jgi:hypothetical protein